VTPSWTKPHHKSPLDEINESRRDEVDRSPGIHKGFETVRGSGGVDSVLLGVERGMGECQGATPTSDKARRPTPTTGDRGRRWRLIGKEIPASKVLSGTYENVAEVGTGRVALSMQRLRQGGILRNDFNDFNLESLRLSLSDV